MNLFTDEIGQTQAEFIRQCAIEKMIDRAKNLEPEIRNFILSQIHQGLLDTPETELNPVAKKQLLVVLEKAFNFPPH